MEEVEQPPVGRSSQTRTTQACQRCRNLKTRCLPSDQPGKCRRCFLAKQDCVWAELPRKARRTRGPSRISQVEQKIDGLVATLVNPEISSETANERSNKASSTLGSSERPLPNRPHAPGSWLPVAPSLEQQLSQNDQDIETDQRYFKDLEAIHSFGENQSDLGSAPTMFNNPATSEPAIKSDLIEKFLSGATTDAVIKEYNKMFESFPFVPIPPNTSAHDLNATKPMLFLAIYTATSWNDHQLQRKLDNLYREELAKRTIIHPRRTLSLLQSLLVYLAWYHFVFSHKTQQIYSLLHLAIGLCLDLGMHQKEKLYLPAIPGRPSRPPPSPQVERERHRALLGCYYLSSSLSMALMKPNLFKYTDYMGKTGLRLMHDNEYESDNRISRLVSLRHLDDQIYESLNEDGTEDLPPTNSTLYMNMRFLETQLEDWKVNNSTLGMSKTLDLSRAFTDMQLHAIALRPTDEQEPTQLRTIRLSALLCTLEAGKHFLDTLVAIPAAEYHVICFSEWMRLPHVISTMSRLCIPNDWHANVQWDAKSAQDRVRLDLYLETLCYRMQGLTTYEKPKQPHPDFWKAMHMILDLTQNWYSRKIRTTSNHLPPNHTPPTDTGPNYGQPGNGIPSNEIPSGTGAPGCAIPDVGAMGNLDTSANAFGNGFDLMRGMDIDMTEFLDMGIWGHESYEGMGFGHGNSGF